MTTSSADQNLAVTVSIATVISMSARCYWAGATVFLSTHAVLNSDHEKKNIHVVASHMFIVLVDSYLALVGLVIVRVAPTINLFGTARSLIYE